MQRNHFPPSPSVFTTYMFSTFTLRVRRHMAGRHVASHRDPFVSPRTPGSPRWSFPHPLLTPPVLSKQQHHMPVSGCVVLGHYTCFPASLHLHVICHETSKIQLFLQVFSGLACPLICPLSPFRINHAFYKKQKPVILEQVHTEYQMSLRLHTPGPVSRRRSQPLHPGGGGGGEVAQRPRSPLRPGSAQHLGSEPAGVTAPETLAPPPAPSSP